MRVLTDSQTPRRFSDLLTSIGWDVRTVYEESVSDAADPTLVGYARQLGRVFLSFDTMKGATGAQVAAEMSLRGGKVIQLRRGPQQHRYQALGRLLFYYPLWHPFLEDGDGMVVLHDTIRLPKLLTPAQYSQSITSTYRLHFTEYRQKWRDRQQVPKKRHIRKQRPPAQQGLI